MAAEDIFDLDARDGDGPGAGPARHHPPRVWTAEEQADRLTGYLEISPEFWEQVRYGTHVRYYSKDGQYRPGGFILKNPFDVAPKGTTVKKRYMKLQNGFNSKIKGYSQWIVAYEDLSKVYSKPDAAVMMMLKTLESAVKGLNENIRKLAEHAKKLDARVAALEARR